MIIVIDGNAKLPHIFPDALEAVPAETCPTDDCKSLTQEGVCIVGQAGRKLTCLASFPNAPVVFGCDHTVPPCEHMLEHHPSMEPLIERLAALVEPAEEKVNRRREEAKTRLTRRLVDPPDVEGGVRAMQQPEAEPLSAWERIKRNAPEAAARLPLRVEPS